MKAWETFSPWETFSNLQFNARVQTQAPTVSYLHCFPERFAEYFAARDAVEQMAFAEDNWDGYGAISIDFQTKVNAKVALMQLEAGVPAPQVTPNSNGTFSFEWETGQGAAHLEIGRTRYSFYVKPVIGVPYLSRGHVNQINATIGMRVGEVLFPKPSSTLTPFTQPAINV
jgi:hypothetical protein